MQEAGAGGETGFDVVGVFECFPLFFLISSSDFTFLLKRVHILCL